MARNNGNAAKATTKGKATKGKKAEILPDFYQEFPIGDGGVTVDLSLYDREGKDDSLKLVIADTFVIYARAIVMDDYAFISYPSFKSGERFINQAFCIDKAINEAMNDALTDYYFNTKK